MSDPYNFQPTPIKPVTMEGPPQAPATTPSTGVTPGLSSPTQPRDNDSFLTSLRHAAVSATRNEIPIDQSDMRGW